MKKLFLILCLALPSLASAQIWNQSASNFFRFVAVNPTFDSNGNLKSFPIYCNNGATLSNPNTPQIITFNLPQMRYDLVAGPQASVTVGNITVTYAQLAALIVAAELQLNPIPVPTISPVVTTNNATIQTPTTPIGP